MDDCSKFGWIGILQEKSRSMNSFQYFNVVIEETTGRNNLSVWLNQKKLCLALLNIMELQRDIIAHFWIWWDAWGALLCCLILFGEILWRLLSTLLSKYLESMCHVPKTPFELMKRRKPRKAEVRPYSPQQKKLGLKNFSGFFIGYCTNSRGCIFYFSSHSKWIVESYWEVLFEDDLVNENSTSWPVFLKEDQTFMPMCLVFLPTYVMVPVT